VKAYQDAATALFRLASSLVEKGGLNPVDLPGLSADLDQLLLAHQALQ
jgi:hypothetical protein